MENSKGTVTIPLSRFKDLEKYEEAVLNGNVIYRRNGANGYEVLSIEKEQYISDLLNENRSLKLDLSIYMESERLVNKVEDMRNTPTKESGFRKKMNEMMEKAEQQKQSK